MALVVNGSKCSAPGMDTVRVNLCVWHERYRPKVSEGAVHDRGELVREYVM